MYLKNRGHWHIRIPTTCELSTLPYFPILVRQMARNWTDGRKIREELGFWNILPLNLDGQLCLREREIWIQMRCQHQKGKCRPTSLKLRYRISFFNFCWKKYPRFSTDLFSLPHPPAILSYTTRLLSQILRHRGSVSNLFKLKKKLYFFSSKTRFLPPRVVAESVEPVAIRISGTSHIQHPANGRDLYVVL